MQTIHVKHPGQLAAWYTVYETSTSGLPNLAWCFSISHQSNISGAVLYTGAAQYTAAGLWQFYEGLGPVRQGK